MAGTKIVSQRDVIMKDVKSWRLISESVSESLSIANSLDGDAYFWCLPARIEGINNAYTDFQESIIELLKGAGVAMEDIAEKLSLYANDLDEVDVEVAQDLEL